MATATAPSPAAGPVRLTWHAGWTALLALAILTARSLADDPTTLDGAWRSNGYNRVITFEGGQFAIYETTPICLLKAKEGDLAALQPLVGTVQRDADGKHLSCQAETSIAPVIWERIDKLPDVPRLAVGKRTDKPLLAFDIVWHTFNENYAFFELRGIDWNVVRGKYRGQLTENSTDAKLFKVLASMLAALEDNHVELNAEGFDFEQHRPLPDYPLVRKWQKQYEESSRNDGLL